MKSSDEERKSVIASFKHLLHSCRWSGEIKDNLLRRLITLTDSIFFLCLQLGAPLSAYHILKISEFYIKNVLSRSQNINQYGPNQSEQKQLM